MKARIVSLAALVGCLSVYAGEIIFVQPTTEKDARSTREPSRTERELERTQSKARAYSGATGGTPVVIDENSLARPLDRTEQSIRDAQDYLRPGTGAASTGSGGTTVILRAAPQSETEKLRQKARGYIAPESAARVGKCGEVTNSVGTIGDGANAERSVNVIEKGNSAVVVNCK